ncbi:MAG: hypothetical protein R3F10_10000 [Lysobacteraceae bacterium]
MRAAFLALLAAFSFASAANAYTPESGVWASPGETGAGMYLELQDDVLTLAVYGGDAQGRPTFYTAAGRLAYTYNTNGDLTSVVFRERMVRYSNFGCIGCPPAPVANEHDDVGWLTIAFDPADATRAQLTWPNGRVIPLYRFEYGYLRDIDPPALTGDVARMLGEWNITVDLASSDASYPFTADVLVLDQYVWGTNQWFYQGCRPDDAQVAGCSQYALDNHAAEGFFESPTGWQVIVVEDGIYDGELWFALYELQIGTERGSGWFTLYPDGENYLNYEAYPARAWRSASRSFVESGEGPAKMMVSTTGKPEGLGAVLLAKGIPQAKAGTTASRPANAARADIIRALEARLRER